MGGADEVAKGVGENLTAAINPLDDKAVLPTTVTLDLTPVVIGLSRYDSAIEALEQEAEAHIVRDGASCSQAVRMASRAKQTVTAIETARKRAVRAPNAYVRGVNRLARAYQGKFSVVEQLLKDKITIYQTAVREQERAAAQRAAQALQKKLEAEAKARGEDVAPITPPSPELGKSVVRTPWGNAYLKQEWTFCVIDPSLVPREFLIVDEKAIRAAVKKGVRSIPGVEIFEEDKVAIRS